MPVPLHGDVTSAANLHRIGVIQSADPGAIGAGKAWIDSDDNAVRIRNADDSGWLGPFAVLTGVTFTGDIVVPDEAYDATAWNGSNEAPTKNAVRDKIEGILAGATFTGDIIVPDEAYDATAWNGSLEVPTKNAIRDKIESLGAGFTTEDAQDAVGAMVNATLTYVDATPSLGVAASAALPGSPTTTTQSAGDNSTKVATTAYADNAVAKQPEVIGIACSDETTAITTGTAKATFRMPFALTLTGARATVTTAPTGSTIIIDIKESGTTIFSTKLSIDASEKTSTTAASAAVISDASLADDAEITINFDQVGSTIAGAGVKVYLIGTRT